MKRLKEYFNSSFRNKLVIVIPTITCLFWFIPSVLYFAFLGRETITFLAQYGAESATIHEFMFKQIFGFAIVGGGAMLGLVALIIIMTRHISNPLYDLTLHIDQMEPKTGSVPDLMPEDDANNDESARLKRSVNRFIRTAYAYEAELQKQAHFAAVGQTAAMVAHDVRKPLAAVKGILQLMPLHRHDDAFLKSAMSSVEASFLQTESMLTDILEFSSNAQLNRESEDLQSILMASLGEVFQGNPDINVSVRNDLEHAHMVDVDRQRLLRVVSNIVQNGIEAMKGNGEIWLRTWEESGMCHVVLGNNGPKIPPEVLPRLFDAFFTSGKKGGTGLGLAICQRIMQLHGGDIYVTSSDEGTEFDLTMPVTTVPSVIRASEWITHSREVRQSVVGDAALHTTCDFAADLEAFMSLHKHRNGVSRLLIVDDEPLFRETIRDLAKTLPEVREHLTVVDADSPTAALKLMEEGHFDYVISDIDFGAAQMDGYAFVAQTAPLYPKTLFQMHSNKRVAGRESILDAHANFLGYSAKPMQVREFLQLLGTALQKTGDASVAKVKPQKVLLVNDEAVMRMVLRLQLQNVAPHVSVIEAESVDNAKARLAVETVDCVLCDINFGKGCDDGFVLLDHVRQLAKELPFIMVSGYTYSDVRDRIESGKATSYLQLPVREDEFRTVLTDIGMMG